MSEEACRLSRIAGMVGLLFVRIKSRRFEKNEEFCYKRRSITVAERI